MQYSTTLGLVIQRATGWMGAYYGFVFAMVVSLHNNTALMSLVYGLSPFISAQRARRAVLEASDQND